ncbi:hypothetical protein B0H19DRAFT_1194219, partial [Mycena capillaripes]
MTPSPSTQPLHTFIFILRLFWPVALLDSHQYLELSARAFAAPTRRIRSCSCVFHTVVAFRTTHMKPATLLASVSTLNSGIPPKFHNLDIPLDAKVLQGAARYLPAVATDATTPIPPFLSPLTHLKNFISRLKTRAKASDEPRMYGVAGGGV